MNFINHAQVIDEFYAAREGKMRMTVGGVEDSNRVQVGRGDIGPADARSLENDQQSG